MNDMLPTATSRRPNRWHVLAVAVAVVTIGALTVGDVLRVVPTTQPTSTAPAAPTTAAARPTPTPAEWGALDLGSLEPVATLKPSFTDDAGIAPDATFVLASLTDEPAASLAERLEIAPSTEFAVTPAAPDGAATIRPVAPLAAGLTYRFALHSPDGALAASWAFRVRGPVNVLSTIPGDATTGVPVRTGIEVTFDQEGVADIADHFSIEPAVKGTFERHGRTQVFVPSELAPATTYTVTIAKGLARTGMDLVLPDDVTFRFETAGVETEDVRLAFGRDVMESTATERLDIAIHAIRPWSESGRPPAPTSADLRVYGFPTLQAANTALAEFLAAPRWTQFSEPRMSTEGLRLVAATTAPLKALRDDVLLLRLPALLDEGWYIVEIQGARPAQAFLQITPVSAWVSVMDDRTVVWVNDVATHQPLEGATVSVGSGRVFATANADGLAIGATPDDLLPPAAGGGAAPDSPILRVTASTGDVVLVPFNVRGEGASYRGEWWETYGSADETYWAMLNTDRGLYRRTDQIEVWGYLRGRDDGKAPASAQVRLVADGASGESDALAIVSDVVDPGADGAFTASLPVAGLPYGSYQVEAVVDGRVVLSRWVEVSVIRKPPYRLDLTTDHTAVITGTRVTSTTTATFFDGTPVAGLDVVFTGGEGVPEQRATTDAAGRASVTMRATTTSTSGTGYRWIEVRPAGPESAEISTSTTVIVFPSALHIEAAGVVANGQLQVTGTLTEVDLAKVERALEAQTWDYDPAGAPVPGEAIEVTVIEVVPIRRQVGTEYDFIEKVVRPVYEYDYSRNRVGVFSGESGTDGTFALRLPIPEPDHDYEVLLSTRDAAGRLQRTEIWATRTQEPAHRETGVQFVSNDGDPLDETAYRIGEMVAWRMVDDGKALPSGAVDRYLYVIAQRGLRAAVVTDTPRFRHRFAAADAPGIYVMGVRFTGTTYAPKAAAWADFDTRQRQIRVRVSAERERYRPGEEVRLAVQTTGPTGSPVAATVVLQAVDQKLYEMGGAEIPRPLETLYDRVDSGIVRLTSTHQVPTMSGREGEGGDTTGGGGDDDRTNFKDTLLFRELRTDASGRASTVVRLSDDLTSWHITASAVTADLMAGSGELLVPVGLPFFVELTVADTYLVTDRPEIQVRAFGDSLRAGDRIDFSVAAPSLGLAKTELRGTAYQPARIALPALSIGTQSITVTATAPARNDATGKALTDALTQRFDVVPSRLTSSKVAYSAIVDGLPSVPSGDGLSLWTFSDAGRGRLVPLLSGLADSTSARLDRSIAQQVAADLLVTAFAHDPALSPESFDPSRYPIGQEYADDGSVMGAGVALLPYGGRDPWLAARVALLAPTGLEPDALRGTLMTISDLPTTERDLQIAAIAGLAALGEPVLGDLQEAGRQPDLTSTELLYLALGFEAVGDDPSALAIERALLASHGERLGPWVRLRFADTDDGADATALLAVVAAGVGDPLATDLAEYAWSNPAKDAVNALELAAYAGRWLERTPAATASFAYTVDGARSVVRLEPGGAFTLRLTRAQAASLSVETLSGQVGASVEARVPVAPSSLRPHDDLALRRASLAQPIAAGGIVEVDLTATFGSAAPDGCYDVAELVPSGLAPLTDYWSFYDRSGITWPSSIVGQEVHFCAGNDEESGHTARLRYVARVVSEGTFTWEPAVMQLPGAPELLAITPATSVTIGAR